MYLSSYINNKIYKSTFSLESKAEISFSYSVNVFYLQENHKYKICCAKMMGMVSLLFIRNKSRDRIVRCKVSTGYIDSLLRRPRKGYMRFLFLHADFIDQIPR